MTKTSITENFINEPIPEDKAARCNVCAVVHKSTALAWSLSLSLPPTSGLHLRPPASSIIMRHLRIVFFARMQVARDQFLFASNASNRARARAREIDSPFSRDGKSLKALLALHPQPLLLIRFKQRTFF